MATHSSILACRIPWTEELVGYSPWVAQLVKNLPAMQRIWVHSLGWEYPLEKGMETHSSFLAWKIPWTEELVGYSPWCHKELNTTE